MKETNNEQSTVALAATMGLPLPIEFFAAWAKRSKIYEWHTLEGLPLHVVNGHSCVYPADLAAFLKTKFKLQA